MSEPIFLPGDYVTYRPKFGPPEPGRVKEVRGGFVFVVYKCGNNWEAFSNYTAAATVPEELTKGWPA